MCRLFFSFCARENYEIMSTESNRYANDYLTQNAATIRPNFRYKKWKDTTPEEMKMFVGITIAMGIITQLDTSEYWTTDEVNETSFFMYVKTGFGFCCYFFTSQTIIHNN